MTSSSRLSMEKFGEVEAYIYRFPSLGSNSMTVIFYSVDNILIDTGHFHMQKAVLGRFKDKKIKKILLTHYHEDHSGNVAAICKMHQIKVFGHALTAEKMQNGFPILPYQRLLFGNAPAVTVSTYPLVVETDHFNFQPIHAPGHSKDHTVYFEKENGWLFSGDLYLSSKIKYFRTDEHILDQIQSLKKILDLDFEALFCTFRPSLTDGKKRIQEKLDFLKNFYGEVVALLEKGLSESEIINRFKSRESVFMKWFTFGNMSFANMVRSVCRDRDRGER